MVPDPPDSVTAAVEVAPSPQSMDAMWVSATSLSVNDASWSDKSSPSSPEVLVLAVTSGGSLGGVISFDGVDAGPAPTVLTATTVKV